MRVLVLGGTGFIGPHTIRKLAADGHQVTVFHRGKKHAELPPSVHYMTGDYKRLPEFAAQFPAAKIPSTVLHLSGLPVSRELEGRVVDAAIAPPFRAAHPVRTVASYGHRPAGPAAESAFDREMLEELKSLGYIR